jgi:hypothetical protein
MIRSDGKNRKKRNQLLYDFKETRGYWKLKDAALGYSVWKRLYTYRKTD